MARRSPLRRLAFGVLYLCYLTAFALAFHYFFFWRSYARRLHEIGEKRTWPTQAGAIDHELLDKVGSFMNDKRSAFTNFEADKRAGVIRVCAFGDSRTFGEEAGRDEDFPTHLQRLFDADRRGPVEVLNFGSSWHGVHQAFMMWEYFASRYGCDSILLGPGTYFIERDLTFNHTNLAFPGYLHARYVLDGDDVRLVPVIGSGATSRLDNYVRFFPHWQYLRYDRNPQPVVLAALPEGKTVSNPFYYHDGSDREEAVATYRVLWRRMAAANRPASCIIHERSSRRRGRSTCRTSP